MAWKTSGGGDTSDLVGGDRDFGNFCFIKPLSETELLASGASSEPLAMPPDDGEEGSQSQALPKSASAGRKRKFLYDVYFMHFIEMKTDFVPMVTKFYSTFKQAFWAAAGIKGAEDGGSPVGLRAGLGGDEDGEEDLPSSLNGSGAFNFYTEPDGASAAKKASKQSKAVTSALNAMGISLDDLKSQSAATLSSRNSSSTQDSVDSAYVRKQQAKLFMLQKAYNDAQANTERTRQQHENVLYQQALFDVVQRLEDQLDPNSGRFQPDPTGLIQTMLEAKQAELMRSLSMERDVTASVDTSSSDSAGAPSAPVHKLSEAPPPADAELEHPARRNLVSDMDADGMAVSERLGDANLCGGGGGGSGGARAGCQMRAIRLWWSGEVSAVFYRLAVAVRDDVPLHEQSCPFTLTH
eukprot:244657-Rhodomonas_salina.1